jgi:subtilisin family serine protease
MKEKAIITKKGPQSRDASALSESAVAKDLGLIVETNLGYGTLVEGESETFQEIENQGYRVKVLTDINLLKIGNFNIDTEAPASVETNPAWTHYLVQLIAPPNESWVQEIESRGINVIEPISAYGLFVIGTLAQVKALENLEFVAWTGEFLPKYRISPNITTTSGTPIEVAVSYFDEEDTSQQIEQLSIEIKNTRTELTTYQYKITTVTIKIDPANIVALAALPQVRWIEQEVERALLDERSVQIAAENLNPAATEPVVGYGASLSTLGLSGDGITISIVDSGIDTHNNGTLHADINGRLSFFVQTPGSVATDLNGHGTHVAGIASGNASSGDADPQGFLLGQGVAPASRIGSINGIGTGGSMSDNDFILNSINNNSQVMNNSWGPISIPTSYTNRDATFDRGVRDANSATAGEAESIVIVFAAGNSGPNASTLLHHSKNTVIVGNSLNFRPNEGAPNNDNIRGLRPSSSRGPAHDNRILPTIVAPGTDVVSARSNADTDPGTAGVQRPRAAYVDTNGATHPNYTQLSGTSMSAPHVSGLSALLIEWWRNRTGGKNPSPAMVKALLINGAIDLVGGPDGAGGTLTNIPNNNQGWGRVSLQNMVLQAPLSDRGPKIFSDQRHAFTEPGQEHSLTISPVDTGRPLRITLVWTDAPAAAGDNPALVNDLDLEVVEIATNQRFKGNVFANGFSVAGGSFDQLNNTECVYLSNPSGLYEVNIIASAIAASANPTIPTPWQDFALVIDNAEYATASPVNIVPVLDRSGSMVGAGYVDITRASSRQFVDLMNINDGLGLVSFGNDSVVEYADGATLQTITGAGVKDAAKVRIDAIGFGGCTYMGGGIQAAGNLLDTVSGTGGIVLLSDGYDNKGCNNAPGRPSAMEAVNALNPNIPIFSCAMGPLSDQNLLEQIGTQTGGQYYFMPTIDDLFEIYNYINGRISGDSIIVNESATASTSRVAGFVESRASAVTFSVAWDNANLKYSHLDKLKRAQISVRLRDPRGKLLNPNDSYVRRIVGKGYVIFKINDPMPGQWYVEVSTVLRTHTKYTVGGFVNSPIRMVTKLDTPKIATGRPVSLITTVFDGKDIVKHVRGSVQTVNQKLSLATIVEKFKRDLSQIEPDKSFIQDGVPKNIGKLFALRNAMLAQNKFDILDMSKAISRLKTDGTGGLSASFLPTMDNTSYNLTATITGTSKGVKFVRKDLVSFVSH